MSAGGKRAGSGKKPYAETGREVKKPCQFKLSRTHQDHLRTVALDMGCNMTQVIEFFIQQDIDGATK